MFTVRAVRKRIERLRREEEQFLKDDDTARMQQGAVPEAPEITISEWQSKPSARQIAKYGSTGEDIGDTQRLPKNKGQQKALSTKNSDTILDSVSLKSKTPASPPTDVTEEPTKLSESKSNHERSESVEKTQDATQEKVSGAKPDPNNSSQKPSDVEPAAGVDEAAKSSGVSSSKTGDVEVAGEQPKEVSGSSQKSGSGSSRSRKSPKSKSESENLKQAEEKTSEKGNDTKDQTSSPGSKKSSKHSKTEQVE